MAERSVECSQCKKPIKYVYKEIVGNSIITTEMCADCPVLQQRLHGDLPVGKVPGERGEGETGLGCGNCGTTLESIKMGNPLGCSECYEIFADSLIAELLATNKISPRIQKALSSKKNQPLHIGKSPRESVNINSSSRLVSLNEALNEAVKKENFEQAAWLRDQIKALMEKSNEGKN